MRAWLSPLQWPMAVLGKLIPGGQLGDSVVGDLLEEQAARAAVHGRVVALLWLWAMVISIGARWAALRGARRMLSLFDSKRNKKFKNRPGDSAMATLFHDLRFAFRSLRRRPWFSLIVVSTIAIGIGSNTTVFSVLDALVLRPFPVPNLEQIAAVRGTRSAQGVNRDLVSPGDFTDYQTETMTFERLVASSWWDVNLTSLETPEKLVGHRVTPGYLDLLGVRPVLGRTLISEQADTELREVVIGYGFWKSRLAEAYDVVGSELTLNGEVFEIVGVAPKGFGYPQGSDLWAPMELDRDAASDRESLQFEILGLLAPGSTIAHGQAELSRIAQSNEREHPSTNEGRGVHVLPLSEAVIGMGTPAFVSAMQIATLLILLIACVNVSNLLVARGKERHRELALCGALGAGRSRILRMLLTESLVLALAGAAMGLPVAWLGIRLIRNSVPHRVSRFVQGWNEVNLDTRVLLFAALVACGAAIVFGLLPALRSSRVDLAVALQAGSRATDGGSARNRGVLVAAQLALAMALLVCAGLSIKGTSRTLHGYQGYEPKGVLTASFMLSEDQYSQRSGRADVIERILGEVAKLPGVLDAGVVNNLPSSGGSVWSVIEAEGAEEVSHDQLPLVHHRVASRSYFDLMKIPLLEGRSFNESDRFGTVPVAVVSTLMAENLWPGQAVIGRRFRATSFDGENPRRSEEDWLTVIGVSGDVVDDWFGGQRGTPTYYRPIPQEAPINLALTVRTVSDPLLLVNQLRGAAAKVDPNLPLSRISTMENVISDRAAGLRVMSSMMTMFGAMALGLAAIGVYGLMSQAVARRRSEIGVRLALGAQKRDVLKATLGRSSRSLVVGVVIGLGLAFGAAKLMASALYGVIQLDFLSFVQSPVLLIAAAVAATWLPAWSAARQDPASTLRGE